MALYQNTVASNDVESYNIITNVVSTTTSITTTTKSLNTNGLINYWPIHGDYLVKINHLITYFYSLNLT